MSYFVIQGVRERAWFPFRQRVRVEATSLAEAGGDGVERKAGICARSGAVAPTILIQTLFPLKKAR
jgi:hypothetical protein